MCPPPCGTQNKWKDIKQKELRSQPSQFRLPSNKSWTVKRDNPNADLLSIVIGVEKNLGDQGPARVRRAASMHDA